MDVLAQSEESSASEIGVLSQGLVDGKEEAFVVLYDRYSPRLFRYLLVVCRGDETRAKDTTQETLMRVVRYAKRIEQEEDFWRWLTVLARSAARDYGRRQESYLRCLARYAGEWLGRSQSTPSGSDSDSENRLRQLMLESIGELNERDRVLLRAKYDEGLLMRELAERYQLTERAVESRLMRLRHRLKKEVLKRLKEDER